MATGKSQSIENGLSSRMMFQDEEIHFSRTTGAEHTVPKKPAGFSIDGDRNRYVRSQYGSHNPSWNLDGGSRSDGSNGEDGDYDEEEDDEEGDLGEGRDRLVSLNNVRNGNNSSGSVQSSSANGESSRNLHEHHALFGMSRGMTVKDANLSEQQQHHQNEHVGNYENVITVVQPGLYSELIMNGRDGSGTSRTEMRGDNECGFGGRKETGISVEPGESLRAHLSDPVTGNLMDDAMILPCGHSYGSAGMQHVYRVKACCKCSRPISDNLVRPNLALRSAVQAFRKEEEAHSSKLPKRRRDRFEQEKSSYDDPYPMDLRGKGVQFPFVVSDRVIIKGNKRTPQRFVGRVAVVTSQCLNGWYVVKTLDNAESVKLQYRSLAKVFDDPSPSTMIQNKPVVPSWL